MRIRRESKRTRGQHTNELSQVKEYLPFPPASDQTTDDCFKTITLYKTRVGARALSEDNTKLLRVSGVGRFYKGYRQIGVVNDTPQYVFD